MKRMTRMLSLLLALLLLGLIPAAGLAQTKDLSLLGFYAGVIRPNEDPIEDLIDEQTGYHITYHMLPQADEEQHLYLQLASGEKYDMIKIKSTWYYELLGQGALMPLTDLLKAHGQNILANIKPESWELTTLDGEIYGIPQADERAIIGFGLMYRADILEALGLNVPTTVEELIAVMRAVKAAYPDMAPMTGTATVWNETFMSPYGLANEWTEIDGKLVHRSQHPNVKAYIKAMRLLYDEGLIDIDFPINNQTVTQEKFSTGKAFSYLHYKYTEGEFIMPVLLENLPQAKVGIIDPLTGEDGTKGYDTSVKLKYVTCILRSSKTAQDAVKFMNLKMDTDTFRYLTIGTEGETYTVEDGKYIPIMPIFSEKYNSAYWYVNGYDEFNYPDYWLARLRRNVHVGDTFDMLNAHFDQFDTPNPAASRPTIASFTEHETNTANALSEGVLQIICGTRDVDYYDTLAADWLANGGNEMTADLNAWFAARSK